MATFVYRDGRRVREIDPALALAGAADLDAVLMRTAGFRIEPLRPTDTV